MRQAALVTTLMLLAATARGEAQGITTFTATRDLRIDPATASIGQGGGMLIAKNGDILAIDDKDDIFRVFNARGPAGIIGRNGEGPGEFRNLRSAGWIGDSLWTYDPQLQRFSIFGPDRKFIRSFKAPATITAPHAASDTANAEIYMQALLPGELIRSVITYRHASRPSWARDIDSGFVPVGRITQAGELKNRIMVNPPERCVVTKATTRGTMTARPLFCSFPLATGWSSAPTNIVTLVDFPPGAGKATEFRVTTTNELGTVLFDKTLTYAPVQIPKAAIDSAAARRDKALARFAEPLAFAKTLPIPRTYEPIRRVVNGRDGTVWLEERIATPGHRWRILDAKGNVVGGVFLDQNVDLQAADLQNIWGYELDEDGQQGVVRFHLTKGRN